MKKDDCSQSNDKLSRIVLTEDDVKCHVMSWMSSSTAPTIMSVFVFVFLAKVKAP